MPADPTVQEKVRRRGRPNSVPWKLSVTAFVSGLGSLSKRRENREIDCGLLNVFSYSKPYSQPSVTWALRRVLPTVQML